MAMGFSRWKVITPSEFAWEQEAFDYIRARLPDADPYLAWQGFNFIADSGSIYEVDVVILTPVGFFFVEVKSHPGVLSGDAAAWTWKSDGKLHTIDNPLHLASNKSKKLAGLLKQQKAFREIRPPFLEPLIFCSAEGLQVELPEHARAHVCVRDREASGDREARPGIIAALMQGKVPGVGASRCSTIDRAVMGAVSRAMETAGIRQSERYRTIADYRLKALLMEGPGWQDWEGVHVSLKDNKRRIRRYTLANVANMNERDTLLRAAKREYQILDNLSHRGILGVKDFKDHEFGPAIIFEHHPSAVRLDHYLADAAGKLGIDARLSLLRQIAEAMKYAHGKGVYHRCLSPQSILVVDPSKPMPEIRIFNWQTAARTAASSTSTPGSGARAVTATVHIENLVEDASTVYMAPEAMLEPQDGGEHLDVFSLGALAYHLFSGRPPASTITELQQKLGQSNGLQISAAMDGTPDALQELIQYATNPDVTLRYGSVEEFIKQLEEVENQYTAPEPEETVSPLGAKVKDRLAGGLTVRSRLGSGSISEVLLVVDDQGQERVLKVARNPDYNARIKEEADVLRKLRHQYVVEVHDTVEMHGLACILMQRAGNETLAQRIREEGKLHPDMLQRFGEDLLLTVDWLEQKGIPHRDLKPDNIGVMPVGRGDELHLVLFDFSLSRTPAENIRAGTSRYMDPFLPLRRPVRWDSAAERWSAAVTLYEMATGDLPKWGDGRSDPASLNCEVSIDGDQFLPEVREGLVTFFTRAFRRDPSQRYDNCRDMLEAWRKVFDDAGDAETRDRRDERTVDSHQAIAAATLDTQVVTLGLATRVMTALDRMGINTVRDLLKVPLRRIYRMRGVGNKTRRQLAEAVTLLRARFPDVQPDAAVDPVVTTDPGDEQAVVWSVDRLITTITGGAPSRKSDVELQALRAFLNLDRLDTPARGCWPTQTDVAAQLKISKARLNQWLDAARKRWLKNPSLTAVRDELIKTLDGHGGVMTAAELTVSILATRGSMHEEPQRSRLASAVVRAAVEAECSLAHPRLTFRRTGTLYLVGRVYDEDASSALCDYAVRLGEEADKLAAAEPLATPQRAIETLRRIAAADKSPAMDDGRLLELAAASSSTAAVSGRLEIYPRNMSAARAIKLGLGAISGIRELTLTVIRDRVHGRYPEAQPLPGRPELDDLLREAGWALRWDDGRQAYAAPAGPIAVTSITSSTLPRFATVGPAGEMTAAVTPDIAQAREFEQRLQRSQRQGSFLALSVAARHVRRAAGDLADRFGRDVRSLDELLIREMQSQATSRKIDWNIVLRTDAEGPGKPDWVRLVVLARSAADAVEKQLLAMDRPVLLQHAGLIARYEQLQFFEHLRDNCGRKGFVPGVWLLLAADRQTTLPVIDGRPVPVLGHGQWAWIPDPWLENAHRGNGSTSK